ncbi:hypothetical protein [Ancylobacter sp.]|uniref:hypothetical protein n=1 Tax=Ancylobacter sp. TaxID=1872567 RepID=UPI003D0CF2E3
MTNGPQPRRSAWHAQTGRLMLCGPGWHGIGTLEEWEQRRREIDAAIQRVRLDAYEGKWPEPAALVSEF